ncbi:NAD(P)H-binding protein [Halomonas denitrificans]|nr:NAD(P)H-binding protein [Halomonas denitrificans]
MAQIESPEPTHAGAPRRRILVAGASGYIGRHVVTELAARGHEVVGLVRTPLATPERSGTDGPSPTPELRRCDPADPVSLDRDGFRGEAFDAVVSCIASRTGGIRDAELVDHRCNSNLLAAADRTGAGRFVLLSAICVQHPMLAFQRAKLAFEAELERSGLPWSIVRPTAFFKSLAGQVPRIKAGKPFLIFGPGDGPACKPIAEADLAGFIADRVERRAPDNRILPVGGPGPAMTPRQRGELLFELAGRPAKFRRLPLAIFGAAEAIFGTAARWLPKLEDKAEFARIGRYYATEPMLVRNPETGEYDDGSTPEYGTRTLRDFYRRVLVDGLDGQALGDQALFRAVPPARADRTDRAD